MASAFHGASREDYDAIAILQLELAARIEGRDALISLTDNQLKGWVDKLNGRKENFAQKVLDHLIDRFQEPFKSLHQSSFQIVAGCRDLVQKALSAASSYFYAKAGGQLLGSMMATVAAVFQPLCMCLISKVGTWSSAVAGKAALGRSAQKMAHECKESNEKYQRDQRLGEIISACTAGISNEQAQWQRLNVVLVSIAGIVSLQLVNLVYLLNEGDLSAIARKVATRIVTVLEERGTAVFLGAGGVDEAVFARFVQRLWHPHEALAQALAPDHFFHLDDELLGVLVEWSDRSSFATAEKRLLYEFFFEFLRSRRRGRLSLVLALSRSKAFSPHTQHAGTPEGTEHQRYPALLMEPPAGYVRAEHYRSPHILLGPWQAEDSMECEMEMNDTRLVPKTGGGGGGTSKRSKKGSGWLPTFPWSKSTGCSPSGSVTTLPCRKMGGRVSAPKRPSLPAQRVKTAHKAAKSKVEVKVKTKTKAKAKAKATAKRARDH